MHHHFIRRCLELAEEGRGKVSPNPLVGCVIVADRERNRRVKDGAVIAEGVHRKFGDAHAEREALLKAGELARGATLYVNLEPCCTEGKQPPCTDPIIKAGIAEVVFGTRDSSNSGAEELRKKGVNVIGPILETECRRLNRGFFSLIESNRPWVTLHKAMRRDGGTDGKITNEEQDEWQHRTLRRTHDAILVGSGTVLADNPRLTTRFGYSPSPRRIILDPHSKVPPSTIVLNDEDAERTLLIREKLPIAKLLERLKKEGISSVLVEGGPTVWQAFEESGLVDECVIMVGK